MASCPVGHQNADNVGFCSTCGVALGSGGYSQPPAAAPPPFASPGFAQPSYPPTYGRQTSNGMGVAALVLGIVSLAVCYGGFVTGVLAIIFGAIGMQKANRGEATNKTMAMWGLILGIVAIALWLIVVLVVVANSSPTYRY